MLCRKSAAVVSTLLFASLAPASAQRQPATPSNAVIVTSNSVLASDLPGFVIVGYDFGRVIGEHHYEPVSLRSN
jgi:hypothetical protein